MTAPAPAARAWSRRRIALVAGAGATGVLLVLLLVPTPLLNPIAASAAQRSLDCVDADGVDVDLDGWPVVPRALAGRMPEATVTADRIAGDGFVAHDVRAQLDELRFPGRMVLGGDGPVRADQAIATAVLTPADLTAMARQHTGLPLDVSVADGSLSVRTGLGPFGVTVPVTLRLDDGALVAAAQGPLPGLAVRSVIAAPPEVRLLQADPRDDGLHVIVRIPPGTDLSELLCVRCA